MKKLFLTSAIIVFVSCPAFATVDVDADHRGCDNATLHTYDGPTSLEADWTANTITLNWYNDSAENNGTTINVSGTNSATCTYDGGITLPENDPTKTGYTFDGWQVRPVCSVKELDPIIDTTSDYVGYDTIRYRKNVDKYKLNKYEWSMEFSYGIIKGTSLCSSTWESVTGRQGTPSTTEGKYCWCQLTGFDKNKNGTYCSVTSAWTYSGGSRENYSVCTQYCASLCASGYDYSGSSSRTVWYSTAQ